MNRQIEQTTPSNSTPLPVGTRIPRLISRANGNKLRWRDPTRGSVVAVFLQSDDRAADLSYLQGLDAAAPTLRLWDGRVIVVMPDAPPRTDAGAERAAELLLVTDSGEEAERCGVRDNEDAILIADRWGQIFHGARGATAAALPTPAEIEEWVQFLAMQCPECGVIDEP